MIGWLVFSALAAPPAEAPPVVEAARRYLGRPYSFGERGAELDCMGLVFLSWADATGGRWRRLSVNPTEIVAKQQLGPPVPGLAGVLAADIDYGRFEPGDVIFFLGPDENPNEPALARVGGTPMWVWHMGMWTGGGRFIVGDHFAGKVVEQDLEPYLAAHRDQYPGIYVVRP